MTVYAYTRVSAEYQADNTSPLAQRQNCIDWARRHFDVELASDHNIFSEPGKTGANLDRPRLQELIGRLVPGDVIVVNTMDRLTRDIDNLFELRIRFKWMGVRAFSVTDKLEVTTAGFSELSQVVMTGLFSQMELERIVWRLQNGRKARMREGEAAFGNVPPFGYKSVKRPVNGHIGTFLEIEQGEAEIVRLIFKMLFADDMSSHQIAHTLNAMGIPSPAAWRGKSSRGWYSSRIRSILKSTTYYGIYTWGEIDVPVPSIVGPEDHMLAVRKLEENIRFSNKNAKHSYMLRGLLRCAVCGHTYTGSVVSGNKYYGCEGRKHPGKYNMLNRCAAPHLRASDIEGWAWSTFAGVVDDPDSIEQYVTHKNITEAVDIEADLIMLETRIEKLEREQVNLVRMRAREEITNARALNQAMDDVGSNLEATRQEHRRLSDRRQNRVIQRAEVSAVYERIATLQSAIHGDLPDGLRNELLRMLVDEITISPDAVKMFIAAEADEGSLWQRTGCAVSRSSTKSPLVVIEAPLHDIIQ